MQLVLSVGAEIDVRLSDADDQLGVEGFAVAFVVHEPHGRVLEKRDSQISR